MKKEFDGKSSDRGLDSPDYARVAYRRKRIKCWNEVASKKGSYLGKYYRGLLNKIYAFLVPEGQRIIEIGCGKGDLLAHLKPAHGVGLDFSEDMIKEARKRHKSITFECVDAHEYESNETFDIIILSDLLNDVWDVQQVLSMVSKLSHEDTRVIVNAYSKLWQPILGFSRGLKLSSPLLPQHWLTKSDMVNLFQLEGFELIKHFSDICFPLKIYFLSDLINRYLSKLPLFSFFNLTNFYILRKKPPVAEEHQKVSVVVAARNEEGNIPYIVDRTPEMGSGTELIFVEGGSKDNTYEAIEKVISENPEKNIKLFRQTGKGKGDAVRLGFEKASGDVLMILDADMTVPPEDLPRFYDAIYLKVGEYINGVRLVYPMEERAMRFFNLLGNKFFSLAFSWLLGQTIKDTLCGTKVMTRDNYLKIAANRSYFGDFDPFGDFDLIFGAAKLNLKMVDLPIRYRERLYGDTNINRWRHGMILLRMVCFAMNRIKFI